MTRERLSIFLIGLVLCSCNSTPEPRPPRALSDPHAILSLDNRGGYSHSGRLLDLLPDGMVVETRYSDVIGSEDKEAGRYRMTPNSITLTFPDRKPEILQKSIFEGTAYWTTAEGIQRILDPHDSYSRQIALRSKNG